MAGIRVFSLQVVCSTWSDKRECVDVPLERDDCRTVHVVHVQNSQEHILLLSLVNCELCRPKHEPSLFPSLLIWNQLTPQHNK